jgi:hypothetical protein
MLLLKEFKGDHAPGVINVNVNITPLENPFEGRSVEFPTIIL